MNAQVESWDYAERGGGTNWYREFGLTLEQVEAHGAAVPSMYGPGGYGAAAWLRAYVAGINGKPQPHGTTGADIASMARGFKAGAQARTQRLAKDRRNAKRRAENAILRELCGTSARAAREDMGL